MKVKMDRKAFGKAFWEMVKAVLLAAIGGGIVTTVVPISAK